MITYWRKLGEPDGCVPAHAGANVHSTHQNAARSAAFAGGHPASVGKRRNLAASGSGWWSILLRDSNV